MKNLIMLFSFIILSLTLLSSCQSTLKGIGDDTERNVHELRKDFNS